MTQHGPLHIAVLVEQEQRVIARAAEVPVVPRAFLLAVCRADRAIHIKDQLLQGTTLANAVHPMARHRDQSGKVVRVGEHLRLKASDLTAGRGVAVHGPGAHDVAHHRIDAQSLGVVRILVAGQSAVDRLTQQRDRTVLDVAAPAEVEQLGRARFRQLRRLIDVTVGK